MEAALNGDIRFVELLGILTRAILGTLTASNKTANSIIFSQNLFTPEEIKGAIDRLNDNDKTHILKDKHGWNKIIDPKDPKRWEKIKIIISIVMSSKTTELYKSENKKVLEVFIWTSQGFVKEILEVTYKVVDGILRISNAWVRMR